MEDLAILVDMVVVALLSPSAWLSPKYCSHLVAGLHVSFPDGKFHPSKTPANDSHLRLHAISTVEEWASTDWKEAPMKVEMVEISQLEW
jgi:hypothetical protein